MGPQCFQIEERMFVFSCNSVVNTVVQSSLHFSLFPSIWLSLAIFPILRKQEAMKNGRSRTANPKIFKRFIIEIEYFVFHLQYAYAR